MKINDFEGNFRQIEGFEGYFVSDIGTVYSAKHKKLLSPGDRGNGHLFVTLLKEGNRTNKFIHRLVAEAFIEQPDAEHTVVHHLDRNKANNSVLNLTWMTDKAHGQLHAQDANHIAGKQKIKILCHQNQKVYDSITDAAKDLDISIGHISLYIAGKVRKAKGYTFEKIEETDEI